MKQARSTPVPDQVQPLKLIQDAARAIRLFSPSWRIVGQTSLNFRAIGSGQFGNQSGDHFLDERLHGAQALFVPVHVLAQFRNNLVNCLVRIKAAILRRVVFHEFLLGLFRKLPMENPRRVAEAARRDVTLALAVTQ